MEQVESQPSCEVLERQVRKQLPANVFRNSEGHHAETIRIAEQAQWRPHGREVPTTGPDGGLPHGVPLS
jgi:hypothetical protein